MINQGRERDTRIPQITFIGTSGAKKILATLVERFAANLICKLSGF
jgi:hypothetical protein